MNATDVDWTSGRKWDAIEIGMEGLDPDLDLVLRAQAGDQRSFAELIARRKADVGRIIARHVPKADAAEVTHEAFVRAWTSLSGFRGEKPFSHWMSVLAVRTAHDYWRTKGRIRSRETGIEDEAGNNLADFIRAEEGGGGGHDLAELREALHKALSALGPDDRMVLALTVFEEKSTTETAEILGINPVAAKVRAFRARMKLKKLLEPML